MGGLCRVAPLYTSLHAEQRLRVELLHGISAGAIEPMQVLGTFRFKTPK
jgi:hypothetical protein